MRGPMPPLRGSNSWDDGFSQGLTPLARPCRPYGAGRPPPSREQTGDHSRAPSLSGAGPPRRVTLRLTGLIPATDRPVSGADGGRNFSLSPVLTSSFAALFAPRRAGEGVSA